MGEQTARRIAEGYVPTAGDALCACGEPKHNHKLNGPCTLAGSSCRKFTGPGLSLEMHQEQSVPEPKNRGGRRKGR